MPDEHGCQSREAVEFFEETALPERFRNRLSDFKGSSYDRGHLVRAPWPAGISIEYGLAAFL